MANFSLYTMFDNKYIYYLLIFSLVISFSLNAQSLTNCEPQKLKAVKFNSRDQAVGELQKCLINLGFNIQGGVTNFFGKQTQQALQKFYKQMLNIDVDGKNFGPKGITWFKSNYSKIIKKPQGEFLIKVFSKEDLKKKLLESLSYYGSLTLPSFQSLLPTPTVKKEEVQLMSSAEPSRYSETNIQVKGIDEPDIVKNDGTNIYFALEKNWFNFYPQEGEPLIKSKKGVNIFKAFPVKDLSFLANIYKDNSLGLSLLLDKENHILIIFNSQGISGYDVADTSRPEKKWDYEYAKDTHLLTARFYKGKIYLFLKTYLSIEDLCPVVILNNPDIKNSVSLTCQDFYIPIKPIANDVSYSVFTLDSKSGEVKNKVSFIGSLENSVIYVSPNNIYLTYSYDDSLVIYVLDFFSTQLNDILPHEITEKIIKLKDYDISNEAKIFEISLILNKYLSTIENRNKVVSQVDQRLKTYLAKNLTNLEKTAIVKIDIDNLEVKKTGYVPGRLLNQFSLDENNNYLRTAITLGDRGFSFGPFWLNVTSSNAVYILDGDLNIVGSLGDLGLTERIYSARFYGDRGYLVTFRETDPFYLLDLSEPQNPKLKGELKIPGYSSYLEELEDNLVVGIGEENFKVKVSLFDVSDANRPIELDKYLLDESWSDVLENHRAFLNDNKHKIFFLPSLHKSYLFSYGDKKLNLKKKTDFRVERAVYIDNYLYLIAQDSITVLNENNWQEETKLNLNN